MRYHALQAVFFQLLVMLVWAATFLALFAGFLTAIARHRGGVGPAAIAFPVLFFVILWGGGALSLAAEPGARHRLRPTGEQRRVGGLSRNQVSGGEGCRCGTASLTSQFTQGVPLLRVEELSPETIPTAPPLLRSLADAGAALARS